MAKKNPLPEGPCAPISDTLALECSLCGYFETEVSAIWVLGPSGSQKAGEHLSVVTVKLGGTAVHTRSQEALTCSVSKGGLAKF